FEPDMLAFSGCYYGGGEKERKELGKIRRRWKTLHSNNPEKERRQGRCPLTPEEVVYGGDETLAPLRALFPNIHSKDTIATKDELEPFSTFSSRMAALDFIVCDESDVFVTNNNGNMAKFLAGRRRYFGHKPTIRPNAKKLYQVRPGRGKFHENPATCICEDTEAKSRSETLPRIFGKANIDSDEVVTDQDIENEPEASDQDEDDDLMGPQYYNQSMRQMWMMILQYLNHLNLKSYSRIR
nr:GDP-fucose protein O-fucosyltransferase [Tanacetum cinerariifolium]